MDSKLEKLQHWSFWWGEIWSLTDDDNCEKKKMCFGSVPV